MTPAFDTVAPGVRRIMLPLPFALKAVNVFLVEGSNGWGLVDSGLHTPDAERAMGNALAEAGISWRDVKRLFVTHLHAECQSDRGPQRRRCRDAGRAPRRGQGGSTGRGEMR